MKKFKFKLWGIEVGIKKKNVFLIYVVCEEISRVIGVMCKGGWVVGMVFYGIVGLYVKVLFCFLEMGFEVIREG